MGIFGFQKNLTVNEGINRSRTEKNAKLIDIRPQDEYKKGHVSGSINVPLGNIQLIKQRVPSKETTLYVVGGYQALPRKGVKALKQMGYKNAIPSGYMEDHYGMLAK